MLKSLPKSKGLMVLVGIEDSDTQRYFLVDVKIVNLRILG
jgi:D-Tyr-tRNAtyr deacylase